MASNTNSGHAEFVDALLGLQRGDFSRLDPFFFNPNANQDPQIVQWHKDGMLHDKTKALSEAFTCACFLGHIATAEYFLQKGVTPAGGASTGMNAFHWAVNRGQLKAVRLLLQWQAPLGEQSMHGGNVLDTAIWSAMNEPKPDHLAIIEELLKAGAHPHEETPPTGSEQIDELLRRYISTWQTRACL